MYIQLDSLKEASGIDYKALLKAENGLYEIIGETNSYVWVLNQQLHYVGDDGELEPLDKTCWKDYGFKRVYDQKITVFFDDEE